MAAVICLTAYSVNADRTVHAGGIIVSILKNPLIQAQLAGVLCLCVRGLIPVDSQGLPVFTLENHLPWLYSFLNSLAQMASPLVLILLGTQVDFRAVGDFKRQLVSGT